jgi:hypothetical protein
MREFGITLLITLSEKKKVIIRNFVSLQLKTKILKRNEPYDYQLVLMRYLLTNIKVSKQGKFFDILGLNESGILTGQ